MSSKVISKGPVVVVGASHAGTSLASVLRQHDPETEIILLGNESEMPYHRPPLSKKFASGDSVQWLKPETSYDEQRIDVRLNRTVTSLDIEAKQVQVGDDTINYGVLVLATGATPRKLPVPGADLDGVFTLRTLKDAAVLKEIAQGGRRLVIIGAGFVGLEVAAALRLVGNEVVVLEREQRILSRLASPELSAYLAARHEAQGTEIRTSVDVDSFAGDHGQVRMVVLASGEKIECDAILVGIGAVPNDQLAAAAGIECRGGILVDEQSRTNVPDVYAVGDVTVRSVPGVEHAIRLESIPSAVEQATRGAAVIAGKDLPEEEVPWFWSDQFDLKVKIAGIFTPGLQAILRGSIDEGKFAVYHLKDGVVKAVETVNSPGDFMAGKLLVRDRLHVDAAALSDPGVPLRDVLASGVPAEPATAD